MLSATRNVDGIQRHTVDEARKWGRESNDQSNDTAPVGSIFGRVAVHSVEVVHVGHRHVAASGDVVTADGVSLMLHFLEQDQDVLGHQDRRHGP